MLLLLLRCACFAGLAAACCATALSLPYVADLMAFVGALLTMSISLIIPALMHAVLLGKQLPWWGLVLDAAVLLLGLVCASVGATSAYQSLQLKLALAAAV
jgi:amino acid permease